MKLQALLCLHIAFRKLLAQVLFLSLVFILNTFRKICFISILQFISKDIDCCPFPQDGNGYIDEQELDALLKDLCDKNKMVMNSWPID